MCNYDGGDCCLKTSWEPPEDENATSLIDPWGSWHYPLWIYDDIDYGYNQHDNEDQEIDEMMCLICTDCFCHETGSRQCNCDAKR